jgi:CheY-like chemotaxis protein
MLQFIEAVIGDLFTVLKFQSGEQACQELERQAPDILVTDMQRPNDPMDGWTMLPILADRKVKYPVVIVSACSEFPTPNALETFGPVPDKYLESVEAEHAKFRSFLQHVRQTLKITTVAAPFDAAELLRVLKGCL